MDDGRSEAIGKFAEESGSYRSTFIVRQFAAAMLVRALEMMRKETAEGRVRRAARMIGAESILLCCKAKIHLGPSTCILLLQNRTQAQVVHGAPQASPHKTKVLK